MNKKGVWIGISIIVFSAICAGITISGFHIIQFILYCLLASIGTIILMASAPDFFNQNNKQNGIIGFSVKTVLREESDSSDYSIPAGDPLGLDELSKTNTPLADAIRLHQRGHTPPDYLKLYDTWAITWSKDNEWANVYAKPKGKDEYERYGFNLEEWSWSYGENAYGANEIKKELRSLFDKQYAK